MLNKCPLFGVQFKNIYTLNIAIEAYYLAHFNNDNELIEFRLILEDLIFNIYIRKGCPIEIGNILVEIIRHKNPSVSLKEIIKYKHILINDRILYSKLQGETTGTKEINRDFFEKLIIIFKNYLKLFANR